MLIDQVLNNSIGYQDLELSKKRIDSNSFLKAIINDFEISQPKNVQIEKKLLDTNIILFVDQFYVETAIVNILENAVKYGASRIEIQTKIENNSWVLSIKDDGIGIDSSSQKLVFNKFFRVENQNIHNVKGLGLGLYYSRQVILAHGGIIKLNSEKNKGTTFIIKLPLNNH
jgi:two-component system phosphate regulon sensor histidine kinase PhoR